MHSDTIISFILPVYNVESYLRLCLDSIFDQGLDKNCFEVILIDDGSTDNSSFICQEYHERYSNVYYYYQKNQGVGTARDNGIEHAIGDYICFVDSDDILVSGAIGYLLDSFDIDRYDIVRYWSNIINEGETEKGIACCGVVNFSGDAIDFALQYGFDSFCYTYLYNRKWLLDSGIHFSPYKIAEDYVFITKVLLSNPKILSTSCTAYLYVKHDNSATTNRSPEHTYQCASDYIAVCNEIVSYLSTRGLNETSALFETVISSLQNKMRLYISRVLSSNMSAKEFKIQVGILRKLHVCPLPRRRGVLSLIINTFCRYPVLVIGFRPFYKYIFMPYFYPMISKN